ncbi:MAG: TIGR02466 family protein [Rhodospirillaceae bacterium]|nr:TIGR02466 family protein [Rhodospirillaceae bacterium]
MRGEVSNRVDSEGTGVAGLSEDSLKVGRYFPTHIFSLKVPDSEVLNGRLIEAIYAAQERDGTGVRKSNYPQMGGWHSQVKLHKDAAFAGLVQCVDAATDMMCRKLGYHESYRLNIGSMWSIVNPPGGSNRAHIHPGCIWSGVYYVQAPKNSGRLEFIDPRTQNLMTRAKYIPDTKRPRDCWTKVRFKPVAGKMLIFPSWLYHGVGPNKSSAGGKDADRIIVSFNLSQVRRR